MTEPKQTINKSPEELREELRQEANLLIEAINRYSRYISKNRLNGYDATSVMFKYFHRTHGSDLEALEKKLGGSE